ncbi:MAG: hypothetical protein K2O97_12685 [Acetatifactor sp.]|nr:hypothetical protein [Acetatifactor sp.]MDE7045840.1 hypothetical protein [Acetatifactor sp.]
MLTFQNLWQLCRLSYQSERLRTARITDVITILWGAFCVLCHLAMEDISMSGIRLADWPVVLHNDELHTPVATWTLPTVVTIGAVAFLGYLILRYLPLRKQPPLLCALAMAAMYLGIGLSFLFCIQLMRFEILLSLYAFNLLLVFGKTVRQVCIQHERFRRLPLAAFLLMWPLLGILTAILFLFGQKPDSLIQAFTQTGDWTLSLQKSPPNITYDEHYLCTVAAGGHPKLVKPLRMGERHGHRIVVNRQLLVANAFEELLAERLPGVHRRVRHFYDKYGYPIAGHIRNRRTADLVYLLMKPLEYFFVIILYLFDTKPENRIAVQYLGENTPNLSRLS